MHSSRIEGTIHMPAIMKCVIAMNKNLGAETACPLTQAFYLHDILNIIQLPMFQRNFSAAEKNGSPLRTVDSTKTDQGTPPRCQRRQLLGPESRERATSPASQRRSAAPCEGEKAPPRTILWMVPNPAPSLKPWQNHGLLVFTWEIIIAGLRWCEMDLVHPQYGCTCLCSMDHS